MIGALFGVAVAVVLALSWRTDHPPLQKLGLMLLFSWAISNLSVSFLGFPHAPAVFAVTDAGWALVTLWLTLAGARWSGAGVLLAYAAMAAAHVEAFGMGRQTSYAYFATLNVLFSLQLVIVGGASAAWLGRAGLSDLLGRVRHHGVRPVRGG